MSRNLLSIFLLLSLVIVSCKKTTPVVTNTKISEVTLSETNLDDRVTYLWEEVATPTKSLNTEIKFFQVANVTSPKINGETASATGMDISGNYCYVTYHIAGSVYGGAIEVFDISTPSTPVLVSQLILNDTDLNECTIADGKLYAVGGRDIYYSKFTENNTKGAILLEVELSNGLLSKNLRWTALPSYSGNSVGIANNFVFTISGSDGGGITKINKQSMNVMDIDLFENARYCDVTGNTPTGNVIALQGTETPKLYKYSVNSNFTKSKEMFDVTSSVTKNGKAVLHISGRDVFVCTGSTSMFLYNSDNLTTPVKEFVASGEGTINGVHTDKEFVYIANGYDGLTIYNRDDYTIHTKFSFGGSANYVQSNGSYIFISDGKSGLKILKRVDPLPVDNGCASRPALTPATIKNKFMVKNKQKVSYSGTNTLQDEFYNDGEFYYCGKLTVQGKTSMNNGAITEIEGDLTTNDLIINPGSTLRIKGKLIVNGELSLKGKLEFIGTGNTVTLKAKDKIKKTPGFSIVGTYTSNFPL